MNQEFNYNINDVSNDIQNDFNNCKIKLMHIQIFQSIFDI